MNLHDFNDNVESLNTVFRSWFDRFFPQGPTEKFGEFGKFSHAISFETEARLELRNRFEIGLLFTLFSSKNSSESSISAGEYSIYGDMNAKMTVLNPNLVLYRYFPLSRIFILEIYGGLGYYYAKIPYNQQLRYVLPSSSHSEAINADLHSHGVGALAGLTLEIRLLKSIGVLLGARYRLVRMGNIVGPGTLTSSESGQNNVERGVLYHYNDQAWDSQIGAQPMLIFSQNPPSGLDSVRQAKLNLSGPTFLVGLRFWF
jgi:hypothetical protein